MDKSIEKLDTDNNKIIHNSYSIGDYIHYYKIEKDIITTASGVITKNILNDLYIVNNNDTKIYEKINIYNIINKVDDTDVFNQSINEFIDYTLENIDIIFLFMLIIFETMTIFIMYIYFNNISLMSFLPISIIEKFTDYLNIYFYESNFMTIKN